MANDKPVRYEAEIPDVLQAMGAVHPAIDAHQLDRTLHHLMQLRASQINGCAFCIRMHLKEAREHGETQERLDRIIVWDHVGDFTAAEKAALAWTEALTVLDRRTDYDALRAGLRVHFGENEIAALTAEIAMINLWNRIQISRH
jgi:AhpD family alkylhydroperoxidase